ncbi:MAG: DUF3048 domain-containing protein [Eubacterium sp.]|nr:DUF3048 domain-containing protein [Eubacterium sp.]
MNYLKNKKVLAGIGIGILVIVGIIVAVVAFGKKEEPKKVVETTTPEVTTVEETTIEPEDPHKGKVQSYLTGEYIDKKQAKKRPIAVMINNIQDAIPQSGISSAKVIYEAPVEGGITRMMAIFDEYEDLKRIGSIRSCRLYYPKFANEWNAIYVHFGQSKYALDFLRSGKVNTVSALTREASFYRESGKVAPHNLYATGAKLKEGIKALGYETKYDSDYDGHFAFAQEEEPVTLEDGKKANSVQMGYLINHPWFEYNKEKGQYYRFQYGGKHIDDLTNKQLHFSNIIIQFVDATLYPDNKSLNMTLTGSGSGWYITAGRAEKITWKKNKDLGQTSYYDASGEKIILNQGKTYIGIVQNEYSDNVKISK